MSEFTGALILKDNLDGATWTVQEAFRYYVGDPKFGGWYAQIDKLFVTDLASKPLVRKTGKYNRAAVLHDGLYKTPILYKVLYRVADIPNLAEKRITRWKADAMFFTAMRVSGVWLLQASFYWLMVRLFGWRSWNRHRRNETINP